MKADVQALASDILEFLNQHGIRLTMEPGEWNSPDATDFERFANQLLAGMDPKTLAPPFSEWGSGGYRPYPSRAARDLHDQLMRRSIEMVRLTKR